MFKENFENLQLRLYQLDRLIEVNMPDLWHHMIENGLESHMYASQWFLTVFTAKFPLFLVFRVLDVFLLSGFDTIFQVSSMHECNLTTMSDRANEAGTCVLRFKHPNLCTRRWHWRF